MVHGQCIIGVRKKGVSADGYHRSNLILYKTLFSPTLKGIAGSCGRDQRNIRLSFLLTCKFRFSTNLDLKLSRKIVAPFIIGDNGKNSTSFPYPGPFIPPNVRTYPVPNAVRNLTCPRQDFGTKPEHQGRKEAQYFGVDDGSHDCLSPCYSAHY